MQIICLLKFNKKFNPKPEKEKERKGEVRLEGALLYRGCEEAEKSVFILLHDRTNEVNPRSTGKAHIIHHRTRDTDIYLF
jgi:hypothetical protein